MSEEKEAEEYLKDNNVDIDKYVKKGMKEMKRIKLKTGTAHVTEDCPQEVINALNKVDELVSEMCPDCNGTGDDYANRTHTAYPVCWTCDGSGKAK